MVRDILEDKDIIKTILEEHPKENEENPLEAKQGRRLRIDAVLDKAGLTTDDGKESYCRALAFSSTGYTVVMARDIDELMVNSYNPEITKAWDGNTDFQFCFDFYAIITYITEYFTKDDTGVTKIMVDTIKASHCEDLKEEMKLLMNTWIRNRQMGEAEGVYRLIREFRFRDSDTKCIFVQTCPRGERSKFLTNVKDKPRYANLPKVEVQNHPGGEYVEQYDVNSKYERRDREGNPELEDLSFSHMSKMYRAFWGEKKKDDENNTDDEDTEAPNEVIEDKNTRKKNSDESKDNNEEFLIYVPIII